MLPGPLPPENRSPPPAEPEVAPAPQPPAASNAPTVEELRSLLNTPTPPASWLRGVVLLLASLAAFVYWFSDNQVQTMAMVVGVLFVHELGHYIGMRLFGYRDVKMFFIPFLGAAVSGRNETAATWQQSVVLLLGPLPGIVAGWILFGVALPEKGSLLRELATILVFLNAFNLLPITPLDGGRLLEVLLFSRHVVLTVAFRLLATGGLVLLALASGGPFFWVLAAFVLITIPAEFIQNTGVAAFRRAHPDLPPEPTQLNDEELGELLALIKRFLPASTAKEKYAEWARILHGRAVIPPATILETVTFLFLYATSIVAAVAFLFLLTFN